MAMTFTNTFWPFVCAIQIATVTFGGPSAAEDRDTTPPLRSEVCIGERAYATDDLPDGLACDHSRGVVFDARVARILPGSPRFDKFAGAPRAIKAPSGDYLLFLCADGYYQSSTGRINEAWMWRSSDRGRSWSKGVHPWIVEDASQHCVVPMVDSRQPQRIYVFGNESRDRSHAATMVMRHSDDNGRSWSPSRKIVPKNDPTFPGAPIHMRGCVMDDGTWLWGAYYRGEGLKGDTQYVLRSTDRGNSWHVLPNPHPRGWQHAQWDKFMEGTVLPLGGPRAVLYLRAPGGHIYEKRTADGGLTWSATSETPSLVHPDAPPMVFKLADNRTLIAFVHNRYSPDAPNHNHLDRTELWFAVSRDAGRHWSKPRFLVAQAKQPRRPHPHSVEHDVSYVDLLVDGNELHLFVADGQVEALHLLLLADDVLESAAGTANAE